MIIIIDNYDSFTYNLYQTVALLDPQIKIFRNDKITVDEVKTLNPSGIIISPGPGRPEQAGIGICLVQKLAASIPILGVCLGHQIITTAFGGVVNLAPLAVHGKSDDIYHKGQNLYQNLPLPFKAGRYHSLIAEKETLPTELIIEANTADDLIMGIRHKDYPVYGVQFHPESILTPEGKLLLKNFVEICHQKILV